MKRSNRRSKEARSRLRALANCGALERDLAEAYAREWQHLERAIDRLDKQEIWKRVGMISRLLLNGSVK